MSITRVSEPRGPFGGVTADGMINVLGRPHLDSVELVIREAAQNAWDARRRPDAEEPVPPPPAFRVRIRTLTQTQEDAFREVFSDAANDVESTSTNELRRHLASQGPIRALELCDFGTSGLNGPVDQHAAVPRDGDNFRNFFFDVGVEHFSSGDGGTYGYGRSALYLAGQARTIVVDSLVAVASGFERRFMACRVGHPYERREFSGRVTRSTGRHFWGVQTSDGGVEPLTGDAAAATASGLGMPTRGRGRTGTSILIPWPAYEAEGGRIDGRRLWDTLLLHLWPKMVSPTGPLAMHLTVEDEACAVPAPSVDRHPVYGMFASALLVARDRGGAVGARRIQLQRPQVVTGTLGLEVGPPPSATVIADDELGIQKAIFDEGVHHVALMRPSELVVRYLDVPNARHDGRQWAGVFICDDHPEVRDAFARSEPPAHDDWVPDRIDDKRARRLVHQTVNKYIPDSVRAAFDTGGRDTELSEDMTSLAAAADAFARAFLSGQGTAPAPENGGLTGPRPRGHLAFRMGRPTLVRLSIEDRGKVATYQLDVAGVPRAGIRIRTSASVVVDGGGAIEVPLGVTPPEILGWRLSPSDPRTPGIIHLGSDGGVLIDVAFNGDYAVAVACSVEPER
jgi:hypothetical protein